MFQRGLMMGLMIAGVITLVREVEAQSVNQCSSDDQDNCWRWFSGTNASKTAVSVGHYLACAELHTQVGVETNQIVCFMPRGVSGANAGLAGNLEYRPAGDTIGWVMPFGVVDLAILHHYALYILDDTDRVHSVVADPMIFTPAQMAQPDIFHNPGGLGGATIDAVFPPIEPVEVCTGAPINVADIEVLQPPFVGQSLYGTDAAGNFLVARKGEYCDPPHENFGWEVVSPLASPSVFEPVPTLDTLSGRSITAGKAYGFFFAAGGNGAACPSYIHMGLSYDHFFLPPLENCEEPWAIGGQFAVLPLIGDDVLQPPYSPRIDWFNRTTGQWVPNINGGTVSSPDTYYEHAIEGYRFRQSHTHVEVFTIEQNFSLVSYVHRIGGAPFSIEDDNFRNDDPGAPAPSPNPFSTEGATSIELPTGYTSLSTRLFNTAAFGAVSNQLSIDVLVPSAQVNPYYVGDLQAFLTNHERGLYNVSLGSISLTERARDVWDTVSFMVPVQIQEMLLGDYAGTKLTIASASTSEVEPVLIDNLRFTGELTARTVFHVEGSSNVGVLSSPLLSFEHEGDWFSTNTFVTVDPERTMDGTNSLVLEGNGWTTVVSRNFDTSELPPVTDTLSLDVFVPQDQPGDPYWIGDVQIYLTCSSANVYNAWVGQASLSYPFENEFNDIRIPLAPSLQQILMEDQQDCSFTIALNVAQNAGMFRFDRLGFLRDPMAMVVPD